MIRSLTWWSSTTLTRLERQKGVKDAVKQARRAKSRPGSGGLGSGSVVGGRWSGVGGLGSSGSRGLPGDLRFLVLIYWTTVWVEIAALYHLQTFIGRYLPFSERTISDFTYFRIGISAVNHPRKPEILARSLFLHAKLCKYFRPSEHHVL